MTVPTFPQLDSGSVHSKLPDEALNAYSVSLV